MGHIKPPAWAPKRLSDFVGTQVQTRRTLQSGLFAIPAFTRVTIDQYSNGWRKLHITAEKCKCCGVQLRITRVDIDDLLPLVERDA